MAGVTGIRKKPKKLAKCSKTRLQTTDPSCEIPSGDGTIGLLYWTLSVLTYFLLFVLFYRFSQSLPPAYYTGNHSKNPSFSESRARQYLVNLTSFGPHFVGSMQNEHFISVKIADILKTIQDRSRGRKNKMDLDTPRASGSYFASHGGGFVNYYENINLVIAKLGPRDKTASSILVSCNYDSSPNSRGRYNIVTSRQLIARLNGSWS